MGWNACSLYKGLEHSINILNNSCKKIFELAVETSDHSKKNGAYSEKP